MRSIGCYKEKCSIMQPHLKIYYEFKSLPVLCKGFNKVASTLRIEEQHSSDSYPWLAMDDERRHQTNREILDKYVDLETTSKPERKGGVDGHAI